MKKIVLLIALGMGLSLSAQQKMKDYSRILYSKSIYEIDAFLRDAHPDDPKRSVMKPRLINLINDYLKKASPEDQRVPDLQEKLAMLKRRPSTKISFEEMNANIKKKQIEYYQKKLAEIESGKYNQSIKGETLAKIEKADKDLKSIENSEAYKATLAAAKEDFNRKSSSAYVPSVQPNVASKSSVNTSTSTVMMSSSEAEEFKMLMNESPEEHKRKTVGLLNKLFDNDPSSKEVIVMIENKSDCDMIMRIEGVGYTKYRLPIAAHSENSIVIPKGSYLFSSLLCGAQYSSQKTIQKNIIVSLSNPK
ncbi:DUF6759 domain-containing protein [Amniculibacterium sp. G2-70]|uniref:DUF6759 domain-containing protein n=1 Tax=Amniculibacterium sp. G2-70 TaxID=2767188 RepID=UPI0016549339|nr:DUF6759 domain-containing protein [Amniculibacterium sp. G2-70]